MASVYPVDPNLNARPAQFIPYALLQLFYFGAWEVHFRGVLLFGWIGLRVRSVWYVALIHWTADVSVDAFLVGWARIAYFEYSPCQSTVNSSCEVKRPS